MASTVELVSPYEVREQFVPLHKRDTRWFIGVAHRRAGKTVADINELIIGASRCTLPNPRFAYVAPQLNQAKDIAWTYLKEYTTFIPGVKINESELWVELPGGKRIRIYGADNPDRLRGIYLDGVVLDEFGDMDPTIWTQVIRPALSDRKGWACFIGTPKGKNTFHRLWGEAESDPDWTRLMLRASETGLIDQKELDDARRMMTEDEYAQEYECSFEAAVKGAYYGKEMNDAEVERITSVPYDPRLLVHTAWDLGVADSTVIWFIQTVGRETRVIDVLKGEGVGLDWYARQLQERGYLYGTHHLPHDVEVRELGTGKSRLEVLNGLGLNNITVCPNIPIADGIQATRMLLPMCWFDREKCKDGIEALRMYRRDYDEKRQEFRVAPLHDWTSHYADAFRYYAVGHQDKTASQKITYNSRGIA